MKKTFAIYLPVWGAAFTKTFLEVTLPTWLAPGNLGGAPGRFDVQLYVYTTEADRATIEEHPTWRQLTTLMPAEVRAKFTEQEIAEINKYIVIGKCHADGLEESAREKKVCLLLSPDLVIAEGGMQRIFSLVAQGEKVVAVAPLNRAALEGIGGALQEGYSDAKSCSISIDSRSLIELGHSHLHPDTRHLYWQAAQPAAHLSLLYWPVGQKSLVAKYFHIHPIAIDMSFVKQDLDYHKLLMFETIDGVLFEGLGLRASDFYVVTSSEEVAIVEMTSLNSPRNDPSPLRWKSLALYRFSLLQRPLHRATFAKFHFRYQGHEKIDWEMEEAKVERALRPYRFLLPPLLLLNRARQVLKRALKQ